MRKKIIALLTALSLTLMFAGCIHTGISVKLNDDETGTIALTFGMEKDFYETLAEVGSDPFAGKKTERYDFNGDTYIGYTEKEDYSSFSEMEKYLLGRKYDTDSLDDYDSAVNETKAEPVPENIDNSIFSSVSIKKENVGSECVYTFDAALNPLIGDYDDTPFSDIFVLSVTLEMPYEITECKGGTAKGNTVTFKIPDVSAGGNLKAVCKTGKSDEQPVSSDESLEVIDAPDDGIINALCFSYLNSANGIELLKKDGHLYISGPNAALHSGYVLSENNDRVFIRGGKNVEITDYIVYDGEKYFPLETTLERLETSVKLADGLLSIRGKETNAEEINRLAKELFFGTDGYTYKVIEPGKEGKAAKFGTFIYDVANSFGNALKYFDFTGAGDANSREIYKSIFIDIVDGESNPIVKSADSFSKMQDNVKKISDAYEKLTTKDGENVSEYIDDAVAELMFEMIADSIYNGDNERAETLENIISLAKDLDAVNEAASEITNNADVGTYYLSKYLSAELGKEDFKLKGTEPMDVINVLGYYDTISSASSTYKNMLEYTFPSADIGNNTKNQPDALRTVLTDFREVDAKSGEELVKFATRQLIMNWVDKNGKKAVGKALEKALEKVVGEGISGELEFAQMAASGLTDAISKAWFGTSGKTRIDSAKRIPKLYELQNVILKQYNCFRDNEKTAVNVKYAAMLYIRCYELYLKSLQEVYPKDDYSYNLALVSNELAKFNNASDFDLTYCAKNKEIDADKVKAWNVANDTPYKVETSYRYIDYYKTSATSEEYQPDLAAKYDSIKEWITEYYFWGSKEIYTEYFDCKSEKLGERFTYRDLSGKITKVEENNISCGYSSVELYEDLVLDNLSGYKITAYTNGSSSPSRIESVVMISIDTERHFCEYFESDGTVSSYNECIDYVKDSSGKILKKSVYINNELQYYDEYKWNRSGTYSTITRYGADKKKITTYDSDMILDELEFVPWGMED